MKRIIKLTERDLTNIVKRVIEEQDVRPSNLKSMAREVSLKVTNAPKDVQDAFKRGYYIVKSGDNLTKIAKKFGLTMDEITGLNMMDFSASQQLDVGQKIKLRK